jgi:opacity protein-like surface antigen
MKKLFISIIVLLIASNIFSQNSQKISGGLFFAPGISWFVTDSKTVKSEGLKMNYSFGAIVDFNILDNFAINTGIAYNNYHGKLSFPNGAYDFKPDEMQAKNLFPGEKVTYSTDYISIPVSLKGKTNEINYLTYFLKIGIDPMINIRAKGKIGDVKDFVDNEIKLFNVGWHVGGGVEWSLDGNTRLLLELLYTGGITDFDKTKVFTTDFIDTIDPKIRIQDISLKVGILF